MEGEVLRQVFPLLGGADLAACACVSRQWRDAARDDLLWKRLCNRQWPSTQRMGVAEERGYHSLFSVITSRGKRRAAPRLRFADLEFYVDVWAGDACVYSAMVGGPAVQSGMSDPPVGMMCHSLQHHLESNQYKMTVPVTPHFEVEVEQPIRMSMLLRRNDRNQMATIIHDSTFDYVDGLEQRAHAYDYLHISPLYPFLSNIRAWVALLLLDNAAKGKREVFGIELDFLDTASSDYEVLCLLDILDWN